jgi:site-specific recombinase XerD
MELGRAATAITVGNAVERFLSDATARNLGESSLKKYRVLLEGRRGSDHASKTPEEFAEDHGYLLLKQIDVDALREFRQGWKDGPLAARKKLERLRAFFRFAVDGGWVSSNPALAINPPLQEDNPTLPLEDDELDKIYGKLAAFVEQRRAAARGPAADSDHLDRLKPLLVVLEQSGRRGVSESRLGEYLAKYWRLGATRLPTSGPPHYAEPAVLRA